jgi:MraZ protein
LASFVDDHRRNVDEKGRVIIPSEYRKQLGSEFIAARGFDKQISLYPLAEWEKHFDKYADGDETDPEVRKKQRIMSSTASHVKQDNQGRTNIPQKLREYAGIKSTVCFIGVTNRIEVWDADEYEEYFK